VVNPKSAQHLRNLLQCKLDAAVMYDPTINYFLACVLPSLGSSNQLLPSNWLQSAPFSPHQVFSIESIPSSILYSFPPHLAAHSLAGLHNLFQNLAFSPRGIEVGMKKPHCSNTSPFELWKNIRNAGPHLTSQAAVLPIRRASVILRPTLWNSWW
jgi:hypothetical protein